jgi:hypothetical protein
VYKADYISSLKANEMKENESAPRRKYNVYRLEIKMIFTRRHVVWYIDAIFQKLAASIFRV